MVSPYQEFVRKAKARFQAREQQKLSPTGTFQFTTHALYKMKQYGLSEQKVRGVVRHPRRTEVGVAPRTVAVMQPVSAKMVNGKETWKQEIWVMYVTKGKNEQGVSASHGQVLLLSPPKVKIISTWRYPGVSPKRSPIPEEILQELSESGILER